MSRIYTPNQFTLPSNTSLEGEAFRDRMRVAGLSPMSSMRLPSGIARSTELADLNEVPDGGFWAMIRESNFVASGAAELYDFGERQASSVAGDLFDEDVNFDPKEFVNQIDSNGTLAEGERKFLLGADNQRSLLRRWRQISEERQRFEAIGAMGFWSSLGIGLLGAATDPVSYIPIVGQGSKAASGVKLYRAVNASVKAGNSARATRAALAFNSARAGFWPAAAEGVIIETAFQGMQNQFVIDPEKRGGQVLPSIAMSGAFSGIFGSAVRGGIEYGRLGPLGRRADERINTGQIGQMTAEFSPSGAGARLRLDARASAAEAQERAYKPLVDRIMAAGVADDLADALELAEGLVQSNSALESAIRGAARRGGRAGIDEEKMMDDIVDLVKDRINRPNQSAKPMHPYEALSNPAVKSVFEKLREKARRPFSKASSDSANGMGRYSEVNKSTLGKGMVHGLIDRGIVSVPIPAKKGTWRSLDIEIKSGKFGSGELKANKFHSNVPAAYVVPGKGNPYIVIDTDWIKQDWIKNTEKRLISDTKDLLDAESVFKSMREFVPREIANTPEAYADFVLLHEVAHHELASDQILLRNIYSGKNGDHAVEAQTNAMARQWMDMSQEAGPGSDPTVSYNVSSDGYSPAERSLPLQPSANGRHAVRDWYWARGWKRPLAQALEKWSYWTSRSYRASTSPYPKFRAMVAHLVSDPFYRVGHGPSKGTAMQRREFLEAAMAQVQRNAQKEWAAISDGLDAPQRIELSQLSERMHKAQSSIDGDTIGDAYSSMINKYVEEYNKINDGIYKRGKNVGFENDDMLFPEGERYYRRVYNIVALRENEQAFLAMLQENGLTEEGAVKVLDDIMANKRDGVGLGDDIVRARKSLEYRGDKVGMISYEDIAPFLEKDIFKTQINVARSMGGEIEMRLAMVEAAKEMKVKQPIKKVPVLDKEGNVKLDHNGLPRERTVLNRGEFEAALKKEMDDFDKKGGFTIDPNEITKSWKQHWVDIDDLKEAYPEQHAQFAQWTHEVVDLGLSQKQILNERVFAENYLRDAIRTLQNVRDIPDNPDSWFEARLPALVKNATHTILGGGLAVSNLADFHRSVSEYGFINTFKDEWTLWMRDAKAWSKRNKMTDELGLAVEDIMAEIQRVNRNAAEHEQVETVFERLANKGSALMSKYNGMTYVVNAQQRAFASGAQGFIMRSVPKMVDGFLDAGDVLRLERMGIGMSEARMLNDAFKANGTLKNSVGEYRYVEPWQGESFDVFKAAVRKAVYVSQTSPNRMELFDFQVQGMSSLLFIYRNWVNAANNRLLASTMSNPDAKLMSGAIASIGLGGLVTAIRAGINNEEVPWDDPAQFARLSIDNGGYLGLVGEANNMLARVTNGAFDANIGDGSMRYYDGKTALAAVLGPVWMYPRLGFETIPGFFDKTGFNRHDIERVRSILPFMNLFYIDGLWNHLVKEKSQPSFE